MNPIPQDLHGPAPSRSGVASPRADARRNREAVLDAAGDLFAREGWEVAVADIAAAARVGVGTVYRHFPSKQHLLGALVAQRFAIATAGVEELSRATGSPFERLERALRLGAEVVTAHPLTTLATQGAGARAWEHAAPARLEFEEACRPLVTAAQQAGTLRADADAEDVGLLLAAVCVTVDDARPQRWRHVLDIAVDGLRAR